MEHEMSSHYLYLACSYPGCTTTETIYTGDLYTDSFSDAGPDSWEGETITIRCKEHEGVEAPVEAKSTTNLDDLARELRNLDVTHVRRFDHVVHTLNAGTNALLAVEADLAAAQAVIAEIEAAALATSLAADEGEVGLAVEIVEHLYDAVTHRDVLLAWPQARTVKDAIGDAVRAVPAAALEALLARAWAEGAEAATDDPLRAPLEGNPYKTGDAS
jgi:hypothetical protein